MMAMPTPATQLADGQPELPKATAVGTKADSQPTQAAGSGMSSGMTACMTDSTLEMTLKNGVLHDNQGRTGYIVRISKMAPQYGH